MAKPTRFPGGIAFNSSRGPFYGMGYPEPSSYVSYWNDFLDYTAADWTITTIGTGAVALASALGGALTLTNTAALNDQLSAQLKSFGFKYTAGKALAFKARLKVDDVTNAAFAVGLQESDTTPLDVSNGFAFYKAAATTTMTAATEAANTQSSVTVTGVPNNVQAATALANDTFFTIGMRYDPGSRGNDIKYYFNDVLVASTVLTNAPASLLTPSFSVANGTAAARVMTVDYFLAMMER